jgi:TPR repeat protein
MLKLPAVLVALVVVLSLALSCRSAENADSPRKLFRETQAKAERGDVSSQNQLGNCYANGQGVKKNFVEAAKWYRRAADLGHARAQFNLGNLYVNGQGVKKDLIEAAKWYRKAAEQGDPLAQLNLSALYALSLIHI